MFCCFVRFVCWVGGVWFGVLGLSLLIDFGWFAYVGFDCCCLFVAFFIGVGIDLFVWLLLTGCFGFDLVLLMRVCYFIC